MKKIIIGGFAAVAIAVALSINVSLNRNSQTGNIDLAQLRVTNEASAECINNGWGDDWNHGRCSELSGNCYYDPNSIICDWTIGW